MSDTPRTDEWEELWDNEAVATWADFARQLERENARLRGVLSEWNQICEMGLQDVTPDWVAPTIEKLWELTDEALNPDANR